MTLRLLLALTLSAAPLLAACGDDGGSTTPMPDAGPDAGPPPMDAGPPRLSCAPRGGACDLGIEGSCGDNSSCLLLDDGMGGAQPGCIPEGTGGRGDACDTMGANQCADPLTCQDGVCRQFCCENSDCDVLGETCSEFQGLGGLGVCIGADNCDPIAQSGNCDFPTEACYVQGSGPRCGTAGTTALGESCDGMPFPACVPGGICVSFNMMAAVCRQVCLTQARPGQPGRCADGFQCNNLMGQNEYGVCVPAS